MMKTPQEQNNKKIGNLYFAKNNIIFATNYFSFLVLIASSGLVFFFLNSNYLMMGIGTIMLIGYLLLYREKHSNIITSVTVYKFSDIFIEILKSYKPPKYMWQRITSIFKKQK